MRLRPRAGEYGLRSEDVVAFLEREGHRVALRPARRGELLQRRATWTCRAITTAGPGGRRRRRLGSGARGGQRPAAPARLGRRLGGLVHLQVPEQRAGRHRRGLRPRAAPRGPLAAQARRLVEHRPGHAVPACVRRSIRSTPPTPGSCPTRRSWRWLRCWRRWRCSTEVGHGQPARAQPPAHGLPRVGARRADRGPADEDHHPARSGPAWHPALRAAAGGVGRARCARGCGWSTASSPMPASPT